MGHITDAEETSLAMLVSWREGDFLDLMLRYDNKEIDNAENIVECTRRRRMFSVSQSNVPISARGGESKSDDPSFFTSSKGDLEGIVTEIQCQENGDDLSKASTSASDVDSHVSEMSS